MLVAKYERHPSAIHSPLWGAIGLAASVEASSGPFRASFDMQGYASLFLRISLVETCGFW